MQFIKSMKNKALKVALAFASAALVATSATSALAGNPSGWGNFPYCLETPDGDGLMYTLDRTCTYGRGGLTLVSGSNSYKMVFQSDGNLVVYNSSGRATWASGTDGRGTSLAFQGDGNIVIYSNSTPVWSTGTNHRGAGSGYAFIVQDDGNLVLYNYIWHTLDNTADPLWSIF